jgi:hypothetical protein
MVLGAAAMLFGCSSSPAERSDQGAALDGLSERQTSKDHAHADRALPDAGAVTAGFGDPCTIDEVKKCPTGLLCLQGPSGGNNGFCTRTCPATSSKQCTGTPAGTAAFCIVTDADAQGNKGCAFVCAEPGSTFTCPGELECQSTEDPAGSGQRLCLPK